MGEVGRPTEGQAQQRPTSGRVASRERVEWLGNLKVVLIATIIAVHGVLSYAGLVEIWNYSEFREVTLHPVTETIVFVLVAPFGFFLITLLFLVAGLLTPGSLRRKGVHRFVVERLVRLGVPFLVFVFALEPILTYALEHPLGDAPGSFVDEYLGTEKVLDTGPLWFVGVLLVFSLGYATWVAMSGREVPAARTPITLRYLLGLMTVVAVSSFVVRLVYPYGSEAGVTDGQYWEWPACLGAFGLGILASEERWVDAVPDRLWRPCRRLALLGLVAMVALLAWAGATDQVDALFGGWRGEAAAFAGIEVFLTICGPIWLLEVARRRLNRHFAWGPMAQRTCYAAFIVQGFVLIGLAGLLRHVATPAEVKAVVVATGGVAGSFGLAWLLTRLPGIRRVI